MFAALLCAAPSAASAVDCGESGAGFEAWLGRFKAKAVAQGISPAVISSALAGVTYDPTVVRLDRSQRSFKLSFEEFYARRVGPGLMRRGQSLMRTHQATLARIEHRFGVPAPILIAIWGLETNYGADFERQVLDRALAGDPCLRLPARRFLHRPPARCLAHSRARGPFDRPAARWLGGGDRPHPVLPSGYYKYAVDFDGDGRRDLERSVADMLASTANFLKGHGWQAGQGWEPGSANYAVLKDWNRAEVYQRTIAAMAAKLREGP